MKLPLEYSKLSAYFDLLSSNKSNSINGFIHKIFKKYKISRVLDLSCGTGAQALWLAEHGYRVTGVDLSPNLLKIAKDKARKEKIKVKLLEGDMRTLHVGRFDAVITISSAIGHLTKPGFEKAIRNIHANLKNGGLYVFDIFNSESLTDKVLKTMTLDIKKTVGGVQLHNVQYSELDKKKSRLVSYDHFSLKKGDDKPKILKGKFALQIYTAKQLREILIKNGFEIINQYGIDGSRLSEKSTQEILTIARKL